MKKQLAIVVGGGLAGCMAAIKLAEANVLVDIFSVVPLRRSHSVCAQGGINAAVNLRGEDDSPQIHFDDTIFGGDFLAHQPPVKAMCHDAPHIVYLLDRMGVMFNRTPEGLLDFRRFGGTRHHRTAFAGATTGQQMLYALDEQVRRHEVAGQVSRYEGWEFLGLVLDDDRRARGIVALDLRRMAVQAFPADAVVLATGGCGMIFGPSTNSLINTGAAAGIAFQQGATYANGEFIQVHPTAIPGDDKLRLMSESCRSEGGRLWVYKDGKPWYFLEERYPAYGNLVPRDIAVREIFKVCVEDKMGINGENVVYLDLTHLPPDFLDRKLEGVLDVYEKFVGDDPRKFPMKVFPGVHYSMGGLWVDYDQQTSIKGLFAAGEVDFQYHGANRLGANSLLSCLHAGRVCGRTIPAYLQGLDRVAADIPLSWYGTASKKIEEEVEQIYKMDGPENPYQIHQELGNLMTEHVTVVRYNDRLQQAAARIRELMERSRRIGTSDSSRALNQTVSFIRQLGSMLALAETITLGALRRNESRGAHYKPEFPSRDDANWLKTTLATWWPEGPTFEYEPVDAREIPPRPRRYDAAGAVPEEPVEAPPEVPAAAEVVPADIPETLEPPVEEPVVMKPRRRRRSKEAGS